MNLTPRILPALLPLCLAACGSDAPMDTADMGATLGLPAAVIASSDYTTGALGAVSLKTRAVRTNIDVIDAQPVVRIYGGKVYVLDQTHGAVRVYDPTRDFKDPTEFTLDHPLVPAAQANPHDIYVDTASQRAFVTFYGSFGSTAVTGERALAVVDLKATPPKVARFIPLTVAAGDPDNNPEADRLVGCGGTLYVTLQALDSSTTYAPAAAGRLASINLAGAETASYISLSGQNPVSLSIVGGCATAIVGHADNQYGAAPSGKGGVELVDLRGATSQGLVLKDSDLGGNVSALDAASLNQAYVDVLTKAGMEFRHDVYVVDLVARKASAKVLGTLALVPQIRVVGSQVLILAAGKPVATMKAAGLYLGAADGSALSAAPLSLGVPPVSLDILPE